LRTSSKLYPQQKLSVSLLCISNHILGIGTELLDLLINHGADINQLGFAGQTPLHLAIRVKHGPDPVFVEELLERGADPSIKDENGETPLDLLIATRNLVLITLVRDTKYISDEQQKWLTDEMEAMKRL
jgi:ankyrin repeat protein